VADINRRPSASSLHDLHLHNCPNCGRPYSCNCHANKPGSSMVCTDCEMARYDPMIHGGTGERSEA
jgi:hypothetical protein